MRYHLAIIDGRLRPTATNAPADLTSVRLALQIGLATAAPFALAALTDGLAQQPGAGFIVGMAFGTALIKLTSDEASHMGREREAVLTHVREVSRIEIREREARLPRPFVRPTAGAVLGAVPDGESFEAEEREDQSHIHAEDVRAILAHGRSAGSFSRATYGLDGGQRIALPSGRPLTRGYFDKAIAQLVDSGQLVRGPGGSYRALDPPAGRQAGSAARQIISTEKVPAND